MTKRVPAWMPRVLFESALIVFSVLLALALNEWRESRAETERVEQALRAIRGELRENRRLVAEARDYHSRLAESFDASARRGAEAPDLSVMERGLVHPARVLSTAWESAQSTGTTSAIPYETVLRLSSVYVRQAEYEALSRTVGESVYDLLLQDGLDVLIRAYPRFVVIQREFVGREETLLQEYDEALEALR